MRGLTLGDPALLGAAAGFSPLSLSPALWLDASDAATITSSGGKVSQWNDKSGNGRNVIQAVSAAQPTTGSVTQNGLNVLSFNSTHVLQHSLSVTVPNTITIAMVSTPTSSAGGAFLFNFGTTTGNNHRAIISKFFGWNYEYFEYTNLVTTAQVKLGASGLTGHNTNIVIKSGASVTSLVNGSASNSSSTASTSTFTSNLISVGATNSPATAFMTGTIAEIVVYFTAITGGSLTALSNYLRTKWATP